MTDQQAPIEDMAKRTRERTSSVSYPYHPLSLCLDIGEAVREIGNAKSEVSKSLLAHRLQVPEKSGEFSQKLASAKCYGIIEGKSAFNLTAVAKSYFFPTNDPDTERKVALLKFFSSPGAFSRLLSKYDGVRPPSLEVLGNVLHQEMGIPDSWKTRIAKFFTRSAEFSGALDSSGFLRHQALLETLASGAAIQSRNYSEQSDTYASAPLASVKKHPQVVVETPLEDPVGVVVWTYPCDGKRLRIETPENMTMEVWEKLRRYLDVVKPE